MRSVDGVLTRDRGKKLFWFQQFNFCCCCRLALFFSFLSFFLVIVWLFGQRTIVSFPRYAKSNLSRLQLVAASQKTENLSARKGLSGGGYFPTLFYKVDFKTLIATWRIVVGVQEEAGSRLNLCSQWLSAPCWSMPYMHPLSLIGTSGFLFFRFFFLRDMVTTTA